MTSTGPRPVVDGAVPPRVLIVAESGDAGGIGRYCVDLAETLAPAVALACLCVTDCGAGVDCWLGGQADERGIALLRIPMPRRGWLKGYRGLRRAWQASGRPTVHVNGRRGNAVALALRLTTRGFRFVTTVHGVLGLHSRRNLLYRLVDLVAGRAADAVVAVDDHGRRQLLAAGADPKRTFTIRNGLTAADLQRFGDVAASREGSVAASGRSPMTVGFLGRLSPEKGIAELVELAQTMSRSDPPIPIIVGGDGPRRGEIEAASDEPQTTLRWVGPVTDVATYLAGIDILVMPSHNEGLPYVLLEAMAAGCAVVAFRVGGIPEVVDRADLGVLVEPGDRPAFVSAVVDLARDPGRVAAMGAKGARHVRDEFALDRRLPRLRELYGIDA